MRKLIKLIFQKGKLTNRGSALIISIYSILIISMLMGNIIIHNSSLSKKFFPLESITRTAFDNWYYKIDDEGLRYSILIISCGFETIVISDKKNYIEADNLSQTFNLKLYYVKDENGDIIFIERYIAHA